MDITKFAQSCILIETKGKRILIDPGYLMYEDSLLNRDWANIDILLITHKHADHCHIDAMKEIVRNPKTKFYTTKEVKEAYPELIPHIVKEGDILNVDNIKIEVVKAAHGYIPALKHGKEIYENIGYIVDDGRNRAYHSSDTVCFYNDYKCSVIFVPVCNHGLVMGPYEASFFAKETEAKLVIPVHYNNPQYPADLKKVEKEFKARGLNYKILEVEESINI